MYTTAIKKVQVPTVAVQTQLTTVVTTAPRAEYVTDYVTSTLHNPQVQYITQLRTEYTTVYTTKTITSTQILAMTETTTKYQPGYTTKIQHQTQVKTNIIPNYVTETKNHVQTIFQTQTVPMYVTVTKKEQLFTTVCPQSTGGYGR